MKNIFFLFFLSAFCAAPAFSQSETSPAGAAATIQPTIMAIPFVAQGQSIRAGFEKNELVRIAITKVKEGFDNRGVNTIDFRAKLKQVNNNEVLTDEQKSSLKDEVINLSGADIYVEVEANKKTSKTGNSVSVIMSAFDAVSGESLANKVATSPKFHTDNFEKLVEKAVESEIENLLNTIQAKFDDIRKNGRTMTLQVGVSADADFDMDMETPDGNLLADAVENWVADHAYKGYYHVQGSTENKIVFDIVKIPLKDDRGRNFRVSKFAALFRNYIKDSGLQASRTIQGNNVVITLIEPNK
ncbi:MAG TPA: hypothetical protein ENJ95_14155 [Bacteroidetes bacterium]|nr:hypothetical protein [Bacteroidota bacterium]